MPMTLLLVALATPAQARPPRRAVPAAVLTELGRLEDRFADALALDCAPDRCFSKGCVYVDHAVVDQPRKSSLPGLFPDEGPGAVEAQAWLTKAQCSFAHEPAAQAADVEVLRQRLQGRVATGWTSVAVSAVALAPLPPYFHEGPTGPEDDAADPAEDESAPPAPLTAASAGEALWSTLLPHSFWMVGLGLATLAVALLLWAWRRLGVETIDEKMLMAELNAGIGAPEAGAPTPVEATGSAEEAAEAAHIAQERARWEERLARLDAGQPDPALETLVRERLRAGDLPLLAKAMLSFPAHFPAAFPTGGDVAPAKLALAKFLQDADAEALPDDASFFRQLHQHALAAALATQSDAEVVRSLREDYGAAGLAARIGTLHPRLGALLFTLAPPAVQHELLRLLPAPKRAAMARELLRSNRLDPVETVRLFDVLRAPEAVPAIDHSELEVSDRGAALAGAPGAASLLLASLAPAAQHQLFAELLARTGGTAPAWTHNLLVPGMLAALPAEARADLCLGVPVEGLAAWLATLDNSDADAIVDALPAALRSSLAAARQGRAPAPEAAEAGRQALAQGLPALCARLGLRFEDLLVGPAPA